jgi:[acyl-carrier-protein] S-malonyltransferase
MGVEATRDIGMPNDEGAAGNEKTGRATVFPGMSPTRYGDLAKFLMIDSRARKLVARADERLGYSLLDRWAEADGEYSEYAQVGFMIASVALAEWARDELGFLPDVAVGPSFGGKPLTAATGALAFEDAVWMTSAMARCMDDYFAHEHQDVVTLSFMRAPEDKLDGVLGELDADGEWYEVSARISDGFFMVSLAEANLERLRRAVRGIGGMPLYTMRPPLHCAAFGELRRRTAEEVLDQLAFADPQIPVVSDQDGAVLRRGEEVKAMLLDGIVRALRWPVAVASLQELGVGAVCICGTDSLFGRVPVITKAFQVVAADPRRALQPRRGAVVR